MELFLSTYHNKVDRKGRVSVPATFRSLLAKQRDPNVVILFPSFNLKALDGSGGDRMEDIGDRLETLRPFSEEYVNLTQIFADAHPLPIDGEGRIILPESLKTYAQIADDVSFVGLGRMFQLWEPSRYAEHSAAVRERAAREGAVLPPGIGRHPS